MKIGLQIPDFTTPDGAPRLGADLATVRQDLARRRATGR